jgi:hypothetical protein
LLTPRSVRLAGRRDLTNEECNQLKVKLTISLSTGPDLPGPHDVPAATVTRHHHLEAASRDESPLLLAEAGTSP